MYHLLKGSQYDAINNMESNVMVHMSANTGKMINISLYCIKPSHFKSQFYNKT